MLQVFAEEDRRKRKALGRALAKAGRGQVSALTPQHPLPALGRRLWRDDEREPKPRR
jgi:hypothetical protein